MAKRVSDAYRQLFDACMKKYGQAGRACRQQAQDKCNELWAECKAKHRLKADRDSAAVELAKRLREEATKTRAAAICNFFGKVPQRAECSDQPSTSNSGEGSSLRDSSQGQDPEPDPELEVPEVDDEPVGAPTARRRARPIVQSDDEAQPDDGPPAPERVYSTPAQESTATRIAALETELNSLYQKRDLGIDDGSINKQILALRKNLEKQKKILVWKKNNVMRQKNFRKKRKAGHEQLIEEHPEAAKLLKVRGKVGQPRLEEDQDGLLSAIADIAMHGGLAADRRRSDIVRSCRTLKELTAALREMGFRLSESATYLRLTPRNATTREGKLHVVTVPVKLCRAQADMHREHGDQYFCKASMEALDTIASVLGPGQVVVISRDDKAKVLLGVVAAKAQGPLLMHLQYKVRLPDHDFPVGPSHCLIPSVYALQEVSPNGFVKPQAVSYSGPTHVVIRSGKHSSSTAASHAADMYRLPNLPTFKKFLTNDGGAVKPVLIMKVDGGPDENPRFFKTIVQTMRLFKDFELDAVFVCCNAPGRSAYNPVERKMSPLSRVLSGIILPHDHFGNHLSSDGKTIDENLEKKNFQYAGEVLSEVWSGMVVDGHPVTAEYVGPDEDLEETEVPDSAWYINHVRESQYLLQIIKCQDSACCTPFRSSLKSILFQGFLPAPYPLRQEGSKLVIPSPGEHTDERFAPLLLRQSLTMRPDHVRSEEIPYDLFCPSLRDRIADRKCPHCGVYFASKKNLDQHRIKMHSTRGDNRELSRLRPIRILSRRPRELLCSTDEEGAEWVNVEDVDVGDLELPVLPEDDGPVKILSMADWLKQSQGLSDYDISYVNK